MFMRGPATELSSQEASDMLHRLLTETTQIKAALVIIGLPQAGFSIPIAQLTGALQKGPDEMLTVVLDDGGHQGIHHFRPECRHVCHLWRKSSHVGDPGFELAPPVVLSGLQV